MALPADEQWMKSGISRKAPSYRKEKFVCIYSWFRGKRRDDEAEGFWRIHDTIYDFKDFVDHHPGGKFWLKQTEGTDITEAFEAHHISTVPEKMLSQFKLRDAAEPRNITLTFKPNGFYMTLKSRVREKLKTVDTSPLKWTDIYHTAFIIMTFSLAILAAKYDSKLFGVLAAVTLCWTVISSHNYFHRKDNWRMYAFNLSLLNVNDWRISHALSHHIYPNSQHDLEVTMFEPFFVWLPNPQLKNIFQRYGSWIYGPVIYSSIFIAQIIPRIVISLVQTNVFYWHDFIGLTLPLMMFICSDLTYFAVAKLWLFILISSSLIFSVVSLNAAHHGPMIYHDGDANRVDRDWGLFQIDTVVDRCDTKGSQFLVLVSFGHHALHHLFPTIDHGTLPQLYPILFETLNEFKGKYRECNHLQHIIANHKQLARIIPNKIPPGAEKFK